MKHWLVCGTRKKGYRDVVLEQLTKLMWNQRIIYADWKPASIIEGCCPDSADVWAEEWAEKHGVEIQHHPSTSGNYLKRNIEMVGKATMVIAFWDGFSYGTAHTIAHAVKNKKRVVIIKV
ncbi:hypothetical protein ACFL96_19615 [Thermoproteota archaeon]